jgi:hypothetical protein
MDGAGKMMEKKKIVKKEKNEEKLKTKTLKETKCTCTANTGKDCDLLQDRPVLCLTKHYAMKTYWDGGIAPRILDFGTRWPAALPPGKEPLVPIG